jgi:hypothetical protein
LFAEDGGAEFADLALKGGGETGGFKTELESAYPGEKRSHA